jgi:serine/threonine protein kinase
LGQKIQRQAPVREFAPERNPLNGFRAMVTNDLGACEWFVWDLRRSGLIDRGQLDSLVNEFLKKNPRAEAPALAEYLVTQGTLTAFQAERVLNGKTQGLVLGPYVLLDAIGQGSMGQVYKAISKNDNQPYAVKVLPRRSMWNVRLARRQVRSFGNFQHPAVVPFVDVGTAGGLHYLAWPHVEGKPLEAMIAQEGKLSPEQTALIGRQVAQGLYIAHQNQLFHGLLKPSNVMVGSDQQARILDFGIGSLLVENEGESLVDTMSTANTLTSGLDYSSPECIMEPSNRTPAGDQYSLGCMLYCCLTGRVPFPEGSAVEKMMAHQTKEPESILDFAPETPEGLVEAIAKLMSKTPEDRYPNCEDVAQILEQYCGELAMQIQVQTRQTSTTAKAAIGGSSRGGMLAANAMSGSGSMMAANPMGKTGSGSGSAVATPAPRSAAPPRQTLGLGGSGGINNRPGVPSLGNQAAIVTTPLPNAPRKTTGLVPSRASFQLPDTDENGNPFGQSYSINGKEPNGVPKDPFQDPTFAPAASAAASDGSQTQSSGFGMIMASLLLGSLAFLAFKLLTAPAAGQ